MRTVIFYANGETEHCVNLDGTLCVAQRGLQPFDRERFRFAREFMGAVVRSDQPEVVADLLGVPRSEPGIERL